MQTQKIWIVDDDVELAETCAEVLKHTFPVTCFDSPSDMLNAIEKGAIPDLLVTDIKMPGMSGIELIETIRKRKLPIPIIIISGFAEKEDALKALTYGVFGLLEKPFNHSQFKHMVFRAVTYGSFVQMTEDLINQYTRLSNLMNTLVDKCRDRYVAVENNVDSRKMSPVDREKILQYMKDLVQESHLDSDIEKSNAIIEGIKSRRELLKALVSELPSQ